MLKRACELETPVTVVCTIQDYDLSVKALMIT
jgi:hypothetical protein